MRRREMSGYWEKISGASAIYIPARTSTTPVAADIASILGLHRTLPGRLTHLSNQITDFQTESLINSRTKCAPRKRPSSEETLMFAGGKRPYQMTTFLSKASKAATILPLKSDEMKVAPFKKLPIPERKSPTVITIAKQNHNSGLSNTTTFQGCSPGSIMLHKSDCGLSNRKRNLDNILNEITLDKFDKEQSKRLVDRTLKSITSKFDRFQGCGIYRRQYIDAGSYPVKLKINKADEFDVNIPLNIDVERIRDTGSVNYVFKDQGLSLCLEKQLFFNHQGTAIPPGYVVVEVEMFIGGFYYFLSRKRNELPRKFLHIGLPIPRQDAPYRYMFNPRYRRFGFMDPLQKSNRSSTYQDRIELIPADVKRDFFEKIKNATLFPWNQHANPLVL